MLLFNTGNLLLVAGLLAAEHVEAGILAERLSPRQADCKSQGCLLRIPDSPDEDAANKRLKQLMDSKPKVNCRYEAIFGLPPDMGGGSVSNYGFNHLIRVNYDEKANVCYVETTNKVEASNKMQFCVTGQKCVIAESNEYFARAVWSSACVIKDNASVSLGQSLKMGGECIEAEGELRFARNTNTEVCLGSTIIRTTVGGKEVLSMAPTQLSGGNFFSGNFFFCPNPDYSGMGG